MEMRKQLGLLIDIPLPGGAVTLNDGNSSRKLFKESSIVAKISGIDKMFSDRIGVLLSVMESGYAIEVEKFKEYALNTMQMHLVLYPWYYLPVTIHKIFVYASDVIEVMTIPIGHMSEEAQEARNKDLRKYREFFTRKFSRVQTVDDLFRRLLISSDPRISLLRFKKKKKSKDDNFSEEMLNLLKE